MPGIKPKNLSLDEQIDTITTVIEDSKFAIKKEGSPQAKTGLQHSLIFLKSILESLNKLKTHQS
jgi:hypothetical protein